jgi:hypothetical protein
LAGKYGNPETGRPCGTSVKSNQLCTNLCGKNTRLLQASDNFFWCRLRSVVLHQMLGERGTSLSIERRAILPSSRLSVDKIAIIEDADALYAEYEAQGVKITHRLGNIP